MTSFSRIFNCKIPDNKTEQNLVHEVSEVVDQVQAAVIDTAHEVSKEVSSRVNGPARCDDETHGAERGGHVLVC